MVFGAFTAAKKDVHLRSASAVCVSSGTDRLYRNACAGSSYIRTYQMLRYTLNCLARDDLFRRDKG